MALTSKDEALRKAADGKGGESGEDGAGRSNRASTEQR